jgi:lipopolysaccharide biosynthesis glycosyltransferase
VLLILSRNNTDEHVFTLMMEITHKTEKIFFRRQAALRYIQQDDTVYVVIAFHFSSRLSIFALPFVHYRLSSPPSFLTFE